MKAATSFVVAVGVGACLLAGLATPADAVAKKPKRVTTSVATAVPVLASGVVLFIDSHRIQASGNLSRVYTKGVKVRVGRLPAGQVSLGRVLSYEGTDDAADGDTDVDSRYLMAANTVLKEQVRGKPLYRMWLRSGQNTGYRESSDGLHWHIHDADSVIVVKDVTGVSVMRDPATKLYYLLGWSRKDKGYVEMASHDGIHFTRTTHFAGMLSRLYGDVIQAQSDPATGSLIALAKQRSVGGQVCLKRPLTTSGGRTFGVSVSPSTGPSRSARVWTYAGRAITADCIDERSVPHVSGTSRPAQLYGIPFQRYGDQVIGFPWFFKVTKAPQSAATSGYTDGPVDTQIASTPDVATTPFRRSDANVMIGGRHTRPVLIARGPHGAWDDGMLYGQTGLTTVRGRSILYYTGWNSTHMPTAGRKARIGAATWRLNSFVGLRVRNANKAGWMRTTAFRLTPAMAKRNLYVNAVIPRGRALHVGVVDARTGKAIRGYQAKYSTALHGDRTDQRITWRGHRLGALKGKAIRLVFTYRSGTMYSFQVR